MRQVSISEYNSTWISNETETTINRLLADNKAAHDLVDYLIKENERLREALADLVDIQNGPPLVTYTEAWDAAMEKALAALKDNQ